MYRLVLILVAVLLLGCSEAARYYVPDGLGGTVQVHPGGGCTGPDATYHFDIAPGVDGFVSAAVGAEGWGLYYGFSVSKGSKLRVIDPTLRIRNIGSGNEQLLPMGQFQLSVYGGLPDRPAGYHKFFAPGTELVYTGLNEGVNAEYLERDSFQSTVNVAGPYPLAFELTIPSLLANGANVQLTPALFQYVEQKYILSCVQ